MFYIYKITNIINNKIYIGQTNNPELRWSQHKSSAKYNNSNQIITRAINKYGYDNFTFEVIFTCKTEDDINFIENQMIAQYNSCDKSIGYNIDFGGYFVPRNSEISKKISYGLKKYYETHDNWNKGGKLSDEWKHAISINSIGKPGTNLGKTFPEDWRMKISKAQSGSNKNNRRFSEDIEKEICTLYIDEEKSTYFLSNKFDCHRSTINDILLRNSVKIRKSNYTGHSNNKNIFTKEQEKQICDNYITGNFTRAKLSEIYNCGKTTIRDVLLRNNINLKTRTRGSANE